MGASYYESAYHINQARLRGGLPSTDARFTDAKLLALLTDELQGSIAPLVHNAKSDHGVVQYTVTATVGKAAYALPANAFANTLRDVYWIATSGQSYPLEQISSADPRAYAYAQNNGEPRYFYLRGNNVVLSPPPSTAGTLAMPHYARPNTLTELNTELGGTVTTVALVNADVDVRIVVDVGSVSNGAAFTTAATGSPLDIIDRRSPFETLEANLTPDSVVDNGNGTVRVQYPVASFDTLPAEGDYVYLAGYSPVPQCPAELFPLLHARVALVAVPSTGDMSQAAQALAAQVRDLEGRVAAFLRPRVESASPPVGRGMGANPLLGVVGGSGLSY
jgi:hypothetical protein